MGFGFLYRMIRITNSTKMVLVIIWSPYIWSAPTESPSNSGNAHKTADIRWRWQESGWIFAIWGLGF